MHSQQKEGLDEGVREGEQYFSDQLATQALLPVRRENGTRNLHKVELGSDRVQVLPS